jgi:hypothetical protein
MCEHRKRRSNKRENTSRGKHPRWPILNPVAEETDKVSRQGGGANPRRSPDSPNSLLSAVVDPNQWKVLVDLSYFGAQPAEHGEHGA